MSTVALSEGATSSEDVYEHPNLLAETQRVLTAYYNGEKCILSQGYRSVEWLRIIQSFPPVSQLPALDYLRNHGLIPLNMSKAEHLNIVPAALLRKAFHDNLWTIYPTEDALRTFIAQEEAQLLKREECISTGLDDPGRLTYDESYGHMPEASSFEFHFGPTFPDPAVGRWSTPLSMAVYKAHPTLKNDHLPHLPPVSLIASVNIVVFMRTKVLSDFTYESTYERERVLALCKLGFYLQDLWAATPITFRSLSRPSSLQVSTPTLSVVGKSAFVL